MPYTDITRYMLHHNNYRVARNIVAVSVTLVKDNCKLFNGIAHENAAIRVPADDAAPVANSPDRYWYKITE